MNYRQFAFEYEQAALVEQRREVRPYTVAVIGDLEALKAHRILMEDQQDLKDALSELKASANRAKAIKLVEEQTGILTSDIREDTYRDSRINTRFDNIVKSLRAARKKNIKSND